jgi:RimJ/RimL family protein N-acetyltransferase
MEAFIDTARPPEAAAATDFAAAPALPPEVPPELVRWAELGARYEPVTLHPMTPETTLELAKWLSHPNNYKWLDFGNGRQVLSANALTMMGKSGAHCIRACHDPSGRVIGVAALQHVDNSFRNAMLWGVRFRVRPFTRTTAVHQIRQIFEVGFRELGLTSIYAWVVETNSPSIATVKASGMREVGRQRQAHVVDGVVHDRILFDILPGEFDAQEVVIRAARAQQAAAA